MKKVLFDQIFTVMKELGVRPQLGTRTNVKRLPNVKHFGNFEVDEKKIETLVDREGVEKILDMFKKESGFLPNMNDSEGTMFLKNLNKLRPLVNPPDNVVPGPGSKGQEATKKILEDEQGVGSLFKEKTDVTPVDVVDDLKGIEQDAGNLQDAVERLKSLAYKMTPEYQAQEEATRKALLKRMYEGKGFDGREGYFRAVVRPFLIDQHKKGIINIPEKHLKSIKESADLSSGGGAEDLYPDPVRMFRHYYGEDAFDLIPSDIDSPATSSILEAFATDVNSFKPINTMGKDTGKGYMTPGEMLANIEERQTLIDNIRRGDEYPISSWTKEHKLETLAHTTQQKNTYLKLLQMYYPEHASKQKQSTKLWDLVDEKTGKIDDDWDPDIGGMAQGGRVGLVKGGIKKGIGALIEIAKTKIAGPVKGKSKNELEDFSSILIDEQFFDPKAKDFMGESVSENWITLEKGKARDTLEKLGSLPSVRHPNYKDMKRLRQGVKNRIHALEITEELGGNVKMFDYLRMKDEYLTGKQVLDPSKFIKKGETPPVFGFGDIDFNTPKFKSMMEKAGQKGMALSDAMKRMGYDSSSGKSTIAFDEAVAAGMEGWPREIKEQVIRAKYGDMVDPKLMKQMLADDNHFRLAEVMATIEQGLKMQEQGMGPDEIVTSIKDSFDRKPNAFGGGVGSMFREV